MILTRTCIPIPPFQVGSREGNLYYLLEEEDESESESECENDHHQAMATSDSAESLEAWHCRFGHVNFRTLKKMLKEGGVAGVKISPQQLEAHPPELCVV